MPRSLLLPFSCQGSCHLGSAILAPRYVQVRPTGPAQDLLPETSRAQILGGGGHCVPGRTSGVSGAVDQRSGSGDFVSPSALMASYPVQAKRSAKASGDKINGLSSSRPLQPSPNVSQQLLWGILSCLGQLIPPPGPARLTHPVAHGFPQTRGEVCCVFLWGWFFCHVGKVPVRAGGMPAFVRSFVSLF